MNKSMWKTTLREIKGSFGRYLAIFAIIALGVGFFSGLKVSREAFTDAGDRFLKDTNMFDFRLVSTLGLEDSDVNLVSGLPDAEYAYGAYQADAIVNDGERQYTVRFHSLDSKVNTMSLKAGRFPSAANEAVADGRYFSKDDIGKKIRLASENKEDSLKNFSTEEFEIVGVAYSPLYLNYERGTTAVGNGSISYFFFVPKESFSMEVFTDIYVSLKVKPYIYSEEYDEMIESHKEAYERFLSERAHLRYRALYDDAEAELKKAVDEIEKAHEMIEKYSGLIDLNSPQIQEKLEELEEYESMVKEKEEELKNFKEPSTFVLTRRENVGYVCFENDSKIVDGIAVVFPVFFFLVAALVCVTTMSRMIEEQRTQIGVLKALGYGDSSIVSKYMVYSGSAAVTGCILGFFLGCYAFPAIIWKVYGLMYGFTDIRFTFNTVLFLTSLFVALLCSVGTTWFSCKKDLKLRAAQLLRPKPPKNGKRIFLERIAGLWKKFPFLLKVSARNIFSYKGRLIMMVLGIGGCTGLVLTGYGIRDSITEIADEQYTRIMIYDELIGFNEEQDNGSLERFRGKYDNYIVDFMPVYQTSAEPVDTGAFRSVSLNVLMKEEGWDKVLDLHDDTGKAIAYPSEGEVVISANVAKNNNVSIGGTIVFRDSAYNEFKLKITGVCENYFNSYAYIGSETYLKVTGKGAPYKSAFITVKDGIDLHEAAARFMEDEMVSTVSVNADTREMFSKMMQTMNYIVILVIVCAAALAFIVLYNLTNINITERIREIATIKVLGFYSGETAAYVFRENLVLTLIGAFFGLPIGIALHRYVMSNIKIDMVTFDVHINGISYLYAIIYTFAFALFVDFVMYFKLAKINMTESLKSIE